MTTTNKGFSGKALKDALEFVVTVDSDRVVAAFAYPSDAKRFADRARAARPDLTYEIIAQ